MKIAIAKPPIYDEAKKLFDLKEDQVTLFTYGDTCYNPAGVNITKDLIAHEETHMRQQEYSETVAGLWWKRYFADPEFRMNQEIEAYHAQYQKICTTVKQRDARTRNLWGLAKHLSGPMYGHIITHTQALHLIKNGGTLTILEKVKV